MKWSNILTDIPIYIRQYNLPHKDYITYVVIDGTHMTLNVTYMAANVTYMVIDVIQMTIFRPASIQPPGVLRSAPHVCLQNASRVQWYDGCW